MVLFFDSAVEPAHPPVQIYMGVDKFENEDLIRHAYPEDIWFHVDKLSSAHVYLRLAPWMGPWEKMHENALAVVVDCAQLTKANSIEGNKKNNVTVIYTPASNLLKDGSMATGAVSFKNEKLVKRIHVAERSNAIINRLNKTKRSVVVDHEAERIARDRAEGKLKREAANAQKKAELALSRQRKADSAARSYENWGEKKAATYEEEEQEWMDKQKDGDFDPDEDFM